MKIKFPEFSRKAKILWSIGIIFFLIILAVVSVFILRDLLFLKNPRFTLQTVTVESRGGWWQSREKELLQKLRLEKGKVNLFALDSELLRKKLESEPGIESAVVEKKLPDMLSIRITERIPRAILMHRRSNFLVDENSIVLRRDRCMQIAAGLPLIFGFPESIPPFGEVFQELQGATLLTMLCRTSYPQIRLIHIDASRKDLLTAKFHYGNASAVYTVILPLRGVSETGLLEDYRQLRNGLDLGLRKLLSAMPQVLAPGETRRIIDTRFTNSTVLK